MKFRFLRGLSVLAVAVGTYATLFATQVPRHGGPGCGPNTHQMGAHHPHGPWASHGCGAQTPNQ